MTETAGNPLALVEVGGELTAAEAVGQVPLAEPLRFGRHLEELYRSRIWALPDQARMLVLLADDDQAEPQYRLAIEHLRQTRLAPELARARLVYREWLRRQRRRRDARDQLSEATGYRTYLTSFARIELMGLARQERRPTPARWPPCRASPPITATHSGV